MIHNLYDITWSNSLCKFCCFVIEAHVNNLPKDAAQRCPPGSHINPQSLDFKSDSLPNAPLRHLINQFIVPDLSSIPTTDTLLILLIQNCHSERDTMFFSARTENGEKKRIDYVLVYKSDAANDDRRIAFESKLRSSGLELELELEHTEVSINC